MKKTYKEFLESNEGGSIISETKFIEVMESLPDMDIDFFNICWDDIATPKDILYPIINKILDDWKFVYVEDIDWKNKTMSLYDVDSLKDLDEIKSLFNSYWNISNYDELKEELEYLSKKEEHLEEANKFLRIIENYPIDILQKIVNEYGDEK